MNLSSDQLQFLSIIEAFEGPVSIDTAGKLYPLLPGALIDLLEHAESNRWIKKTKEKDLILTEELPLKIRKKINNINNQDHLSKLIDRIREQKLIDTIDTKIFVNLLYKAGRFSEAGKLEIKIAKHAFGEYRFEQGLTNLKNAAKYLKTNSEDSETIELFISTTLEWLNKSFAIGEKSSDVEALLNQTIELSNLLGDIRSRALLNLHLGRHYYFTARRDGALVALSIGVEEIEELGDKDIHFQSASFLGLYFFILGKLEDSFKHLETAIQADALGDTERQTIKDPMAPIFFGYCAAYLGKFNQAIGSIDFHCRLAESKNDKIYATTLRAVLGTVLVLLKKKQEAKIHLDKTKEDARATKNALALYLCRGGLALYNFINGDIENAHKILLKSVIEGTKAGLVQQFSSPWILEMLYEFHQLGFDPIPSLEFDNVMKKIMNGVNCHLQGACLRLKAKMVFGQSGAHNKVKTYLEKSTEKLKEAGDPIQLSKTLIAMAQLELIQGHRKKARQFALEARQVLGNYADEFFPEEFNDLVEKKGLFSGREFNEEQFIDQYLAMIESLYPSKNRMEILSKMLTATSQIFGAERSGLFWFPDSETGEIPELQAALNLPRIEVESKNFKPSLKVIRKAHKSNRPFIEELLLKEFSLGKKFVRSVLCIPIETQGVLYYDNSYIKNAFAFLNLSMIKRMVRHTNTVINSCIDHMNVINKADKLASEKKMLWDDKSQSILTQSKKVQTLLTKVAQIAKTESTVLILGETGTGKELFANQIHSQSHRHNEPFIIVDSTTISENLIESELFGHEKGAFTGADKRKIGCIEMSDRGTLFLDEVGELTLSAQAKLLRALQEKTIRRVGGVTSIKADFRLVAATNRNLEAEVKKGRFREDLYYRLNVVPLHLPSLKERGEDVIFLAEYFMGVYCKKYNASHFELSATEKNHLLNYPWPGNVRELKNVIERSVLLSNDLHFELDLPQRGRELDMENPFTDRPTLNEMQRRYIKYILDLTNDKISGPGSACEILGLKRTTLYSKMKALNLKR